MISTVKSTDPGIRQSSFQNFENVAADNVQALAFNSPGNRIAFASADHKLRVYNSNPAREWTLFDQWRGHDADVLDASRSTLHIQWVDSGLGQLLASIGSDNKFKIWREDTSQVHTRGRRFKCIFSQSPPDHVSYAAFDFIVRNQEIYVALISQSGLLSLLEPSDPTSLGSWREIDALYPFGQQHRSDEPRLDLSFHQALSPSSQALQAGLDPCVLSLVVSSANGIKVYRALKSEEEIYQVHEVGELPVDDTLVNAVAWAPGCVNPIDTIAVACDDSTVRVVEIAVQKLPMSILSARNQPSHVAAGRVPARAQSIASGISAGLAGMNRKTVARSCNGPVSLKHEAKEVAALPHSYGVPVLRVKWNLDGSMLGSTGDDGRVHMWRQSVNGEWLEFSKTEFF
ncbi:MAG: hypothetical protein Q9217_006917 [Psora testacea]